MGSNFIWRGFDGSEIVGLKSVTGYNSPLGKAEEKIRTVMDAHPEDDPLMVLWGVETTGEGLPGKTSGISAV